MRKALTSNNVFNGYNIVHVFPRDIIFFITLVVVDKTQAQCGGIHEIPTHVQGGAALIGITALVGGASRPVLLNACTAVLARQETLVRPYFFFSFQSAFAVVQGSVGGGIQNDKQDSRFALECQEANHYCRTRL